MRTRIAIIVIAAFITASLGPAVVAQSDPDSKALASYRLTMATTQKVTDAFRAVAAKLAADPRVQAIQKQKAELRAIEAKEDPTEADEARKEQLEAAIEKTETGLAGGDWDGKTLSEMEANIAKTPYLADALRQVGLAPREFAKYFLVMFQASFAYGMQKAGQLKTLPEGVNPDNVKFIAEHENEIKAMTADLQKLGK